MIVVETFAVIASANHRIKLNKHIIEQKKKKINLIKFNLRFTTCNLQMTYKISVSASLYTYVVIKVLVCGFQNINF